MYRLLLVEAIIFVCLPCLHQQELGTLGIYNYDPILSTDIGFDENIAKGSKLGQLESRSGVIETSRETKQTNSYVEDSLTGNLNSFEDLKRYIVETNEGDGGLKTANGTRGSRDISVSDELSSKKVYVGTSKLSDEHFDDDGSEFQSTRGKEKERFRRSTADSGIRIRRATHPTSPCPDVFSYEGTGPENGKWDGVMILTTDEAMSGVKIEVRLDKIATLVESTVGRVSSSDNIIYTIWSSRTKLEPGSSLSVGITVNYNENGNEPPGIQIIKLNGRQICPRSYGGIITLPGISSRPTGFERPTNTGTLPSRPPPSRPIDQTDDNEIVDGVACGKIEVQASPLITHGQRTSRGQWPWHAAIYKSKGADLSYICGGSLIGKRTILTAAHCVSRRFIDRPVDSEELVVYLGKYHLKLWSEGGVQDRQVLEIHMHPEYNSTNFRSDIAILILSNTVDFTEFVRPVCLWNKNRGQLSEMEGRDGVVVGWGFDETGTLTDDLMMATMPVVSQQTCIWSYPQFFSRFTSDKTYCAGFRNGTSVCNGDSGGGMVFPKSEAYSGDKVTWSLRGIVSLSTTQENKRVCNTKHYVVFTDVVKFHDWIQKYR